MRIADYLKEQRIKHGYSIEELSERTGVGYSLIFDLELHDDELTVISVSDLKRLCQGLSINPQDILETIVSDIEDLPLPSLLRSRREAMHYSIERLSDIIGYEQCVIEALESDRNDTEVCIDAVKNIAAELFIPLSLIFSKL